MAAEDGQLADAAPLRRVLPPAGLWGLGVAYVISGMYFGWNLGLPAAGSAGFFAATLVATAAYIAFVLCYAELACALPGAGGAFVYAARAFGPFVGFLVGFARALEFVFASPAIAVAIGAHVHLALPWAHPALAASAVYLLFTALNIYSARQSVAFGLWAAAAALVGLVVFAVATVPHVTSASLRLDALPQGWTGAWHALPYAVWFYLGIEGLANVAEEAHDPQRDLPRGFGSAMATLVAAALVTFAGAVGVAGWRAAALAANCAVGLLAIVSGTTGVLITLSVLSALTTYALSLASLFALRSRAPELARPFRTPYYPALPALALALVLACLAAVASSNLRESALFAGAMAAGAA